MGRRSFYLVLGACLALDDRTNYVLLERYTSERPSLNIDRRTPQAHHAWIILPLLSFRDLMQLTKPSNRAAAIAQVKLEIGANTPVKAGKRMRRKGKSGYHSRLSSTRIGNGNDHPRRNRRRMHRGA